MRVKCRFHFAQFCKKFLTEKRRAVFSAKTFAVLAPQQTTVFRSQRHHVIISDASTQKKGLTAAGFKPLVMPPKTSQPLKAKMASAPVLTYINDYGARMPLIFRCEGNTCKVDEDQSSKG